MTQFFHIKTWESFCPIHFIIAARVYEYLSVYLPVIL